MGLNEVRCTASETLGHDIKTRVRNPSGTMERLASAKATASERAVALAVKPSCHEEH